MNVPLRLRVLGTAFVLALFGSAACAPVPVDASPTECAADGYESNDEAYDAHELAPMKDDPDTRQRLAATMHRKNDEDWYRVHVSDTGFGGDPNVTVAVPDGYEVSTWFVCDDGHHGSTECLVGSEEYEEIDGGARGCRGETDPETGDVVVRSTTDCTGTSTDSGTLYIRARFRTPSRACTYDLSVSVD